MSQTKKAAKKAAVTKPSVKAIASKPNESEPKKVATKPSTKKAAKKTTAKKQPAKAALLDIDRDGFANKSEKTSDKRVDKNKNPERPYIIEIENTSQSEKNFVLFGSGENRTLPNFGNPDGISIQYGLMGYTYRQLLADSENTGFHFTKILLYYTEMKNGKAVSKQFPFVKLEGAKDAKEDELLWKKSEHNGLETTCDFHVDGGVKMCGTLPAKSSLRVTFYGKREEAPANIEHYASVTPPNPNASRPYILSIRNNSMTEIKGFRLNNIHQAIRQGEYDDRVTVEYLLGNYTYQAFLHHFVTHPTKFGRVRIDAFHGYAPYQQRQLLQPMTVVYTDPNGDEKRKVLVLDTALNQFITTAVELPCDFDLIDMSWDIHLNLVPDASIRLSLFPAVTMNLWMREKKNLAPPQIGAIQTIRLVSDDSDEKISLKKENEALHKELAKRAGKVKK